MTCTLMAPAPAAGQEHADLGTFVADGVDSSGEPIGGAVQASDQAHAHTPEVVPPPPATLSPTVRTLASDAQLQAGGRARDRVWISGLRATDRVRIQWRLLGPAQPVDGGCRRVDWAKQNTRAHGAFNLSGNGANWTPKVRLKRPGCYTFAESIAATATTHATVHTPGKVPQTVRVFPKRRAPLIATGSSGWLD